MENVGDPSWTNVALHGPGYSGNTPLVQRRAFFPTDDVSAWHVYAVDWTPESLVFSVDDQVFYTVPKAMVETHGRWALRQPEIPDREPRDRRAAIPRASTALPSPIPVSPLRPSI